MARGRKKSTTQIDLEKTYKKARHAAAQRLSVERKKAKAAGKDFTKTLPKMPKRITKASVTKIAQFARKSAVVEPILKPTTEAEKTYYAERRAAAARIKATKSKETLPHIPANITQRDIEDVATLALSYEENIKKVKASTPAEVDITTGELKDAADDNTITIDAETGEVVEPNKVTREPVLITQKPKRKSTLKRANVVTFGDMAYEHLNEFIEAIVNSMKYHPQLETKGDALIDILRKHKTDFHNITNKEEADATAEMEADIEEYLFASEESREQMALSRIINAMENISVLDDNDRQQLKALAEYDANNVYWSPDGDPDYLDGDDSDYY